MAKNITISIPEELAKKMETCPDVNWSEICRQAIDNYIRIRNGTIPAAWRIS